MYNQILLACLMSLFIFAPFHVIHANEAYDLFHKVKYAPEEENCFDIVTEIKADSKGKVIAWIPASKDINVQASSIEGKNHFTVLMKGQEAEVTTKKHTKVSFKYRACSQNSYRITVHPTIEKDFFYFSTTNIFITPIVSDAEAQKTKTIKLDFTGLPETFNFISNHGINRAYTIQETLEKFKDNAFTATTSPLKTIYIKGNPVYILTTGKWKMFKEGFASYVQKIITTQRTFWNDFDFPHYAVIFMEQNLPMRQSIIAGTHRKNMVTMSIPNLTGRGFESATFASLSHELSHAWLGDKMASTLMQERLQWFFEGINDYYGARFAFESGVIDENDYIRHFNGLLREYYLSPYKEINNIDIGPHYSGTTLVSKISEPRTHMLFRTFTYKAQKDGSLNVLDMVMKKIYEEFKGKVVSEDRLHQIFSDNFGKDTWNEMRKKIEGEALDFPPQDLFKGKAVLDTKWKTKAPCFGFDEKSFVKDKSIKKLNPTSNAYRAGVREGQEVLNHVIPFTASEPRIATLIVREGEETKSINFLPDRLIEKEIPQYVLFNRYLKKDF